MRGTAYLESETDAFHCPVLYLRGSMLFYSPTDRKGVFPQMNRQASWTSAVLTWLSHTDNCQVVCFSEYLPFTRDKHLFKLTLGFLFAVLTSAVTPVLHIISVPSPHRGQILVEDLIHTNSN